MSQRPLPESIRGSWYYLPESGLKSIGEKLPPIYIFQLDGRFSLMNARDGELIEKDRGTYTFDGNFLIIRGRNTDTYRVRVRDWWRWNLEGKKEDQVLVRGLFPPDERVQLLEEEKKEIRILPIRVVVDEPATGTGSIHRLVYRPASGEPRLVGSFFAEFEEQEGKVWIGISPATDDINIELWERIIKESYLDIYRAKSQDIRVVTLRFLDSNESRVFRYAM